MKRNYQREMESMLENVRQLERRPRLLLHSCCAPCSSYVLECLKDSFQITGYYYNPNITEEEEYRKRSEELERLFAEFEWGDAAVKSDVLIADYSSEIFFAAVMGMEACQEGGVRCFVCYEQRLRETARMAKEKGYDYFTTSLSISPLKNADKLNEIGERLGREYGVVYLVSDFKKKEGYKRSVELSRQYGLYRQNYCGCVYSQRESERLLSGERM